MRFACSLVFSASPLFARNLNRYKPRTVSRFSDSSWVRLLLLLAIIAPPLFVGLGAADCEFHMEVRTLATAQETWIRQQHDPHAWLVPSWNGAPRVNKPPLTVWLNMLVWSGLDPATTSVDTLVLRARAAAAGLCLAALLAVWGIGAALHGSRFGLLAAAITGSCLLFLRNARMASYDTYLLAFCTFSLAAGIWAMQSRAKKPRRGVTLSGWLICGIAMAAAFLTKGPIALVMTALPLAAIAITGARKERDIAGLLGALLLAAALVLPWYLYVLDTIAAADQIMGTEFKATRNEFQAPWYYLCLIPLVFPWLFWLPAFWIGAIRRQYDTRNPAIRIPALWFLAIFIVLSIPAAKQQRYIIPILPAAGLLIAAAWQSIAAQNKLRWPQGLTRIHAGFLTIASLLYGSWGLAHPWLVSLGALEQPAIVRLPAWSFAITAIPLSVLARAIRKPSVEAAVWLTALWMTLAATPALYDYAFNHHSRYTQRADVESVMREVGNAQLFYATAPELPDSKEWPDPKMLLYGRRIIPHWDENAVNPGTFLMAAQHDGLDRKLRAAGWIPVRLFDDGNSPRRLYRAPD